MGSKYNYILQLVDIFQGFLDILFSILLIFPLSKYLLKKLNYLCSASHSLDVANFIRMLISRFPFAYIFYKCVVRFKGLIRFKFFLEIIYLVVSFYDISSHLMIIA